MDLNEIANLVTIGTLTGLALGSTYLHRDVKKTERSSEKLLKETQAQVESSSPSRLEEFLKDSELNRKAAKLIIPHLSIKKIGDPKKVLGGIEHKFSINGKQYIHTEDDPNSNLINLPNNHYRNIESLPERELVRQVYQILRFS
jgi:hypothetical protein